MNSDDLRVWLLLLLVCGVSIWLAVLFVRLCGDVKAIKGILKTACGLEELRGHGGALYRRRGANPADEASSSRADFLE
jgi:hypothetical protein